VPLLIDRHLVDLLVFAAIYAIAGLGVALLLGQCGILNVGQSLFYGIGAYASAIVTTSLGWPAPLGMLAGMVVSVLLAVLMGWPILRLSGFFLALATLAIGMMGHVLFNEWEPLTGGEIGLSGIPKLNFLGITLDTPVSYFYLVGSIALAAVVLAGNLTRGRTGLAMRAMRDAPNAAAVLGVEMHHLKVLMFALSAALGALAGSLFAHYVSFVSVASFSIERSIMFLLIPVIAGVHSVRGVLLGALFITFVPEWLSGLGDIHRVLFGVALVLVVTFLPEGMVGIVTKRMGRGGEA
jgi:branched-chain amino acid transport system permease protein